MYYQDDYDLYEEKKKQAQKERKRVYSQAYHEKVTRVIREGRSKKEAKELATNFVAVAEQKLSSNAAQLPQSWTEFVVERWPFKFCQDRDLFLEGLLKAGLPE